MLSGSVQVGIAAGTFGVFSAFAKGAPVRVIGGTMTGVTDQFWYVRADSPIHSFKETEGKTIAFSTPGSSTQIAVLSLLNLYGVKTAKPVATGGPAVTLTQVMTNQIDVGWSTAPPGGRCARGRYQGGSSPVLARCRGCAIRPSAGSSPMRTRLARNRDAIVRYMGAVREITARIYDNPDGLRMLAEVSMISEPSTAVGAEFLPKEADRCGPASPASTRSCRMRSAGKYIPAPLTPSQLKELIQVPLQ